MFLLQLGVLLLSSFSSLYPQVFKNAKETNLVKRIPIGFSWWAPADDDWRSSLTGIAGARAGIELFPVKEDLTPEDGMLRLYFRSLINWRLGTGSKTTYSAMFNEVGLQAGAFVRLNITRQHAIFAGAGPMYAFEICTFDHKYGSRKTETRRGAALFLTAGYSFQIKPRTSLFLEVEYNHFITEGLINSIIPTAGITFGL